MEEAIRLFDDYDYNGSRISLKKDTSGGGDRPPRDDRSFRDDRRDDRRRFDRSPPRYRDNRRSNSPPRHREPRQDSPPRGRQGSPNAERSPKRSPDRSGNGW